MLCDTKVPLYDASVPCGEPTHCAEDFVETADSLATFPYAHEAYIPIRPLKHEYRKVSVKNYLMFFWVEEETKVVTIARVIYAARDYGKLLK